MYPFSVTMPSALLLIKNLLSCASSDFVKENFMSSVGDICSNNNLSSDDCWEVPATVVSYCHFVAVEFY